MMRRVFHQFDKNNDGQIDRSELQEVFKELGHCLSSGEIDRLIAMADRDGSGTLDYNEFIREVYGVSE